MTQPNLVCPYCNKGALTEGTYSDAFNHKGGVVTVHNLEHYLCDTCDADPIFPPQIDRNHHRINEAKRAHDGLLRGAEIKNIQRKPVAAGVGVGK